jgi:hypothetical protein
MLPVTCSIDWLNREQQKNVEVRSIQRYQSTAAQNIVGCLRGNEDAIC